MSSADVGKHGLTADGWSVDVDSNAIARLRSGVNPNLVVFFFGGGTFSIKGRGRSFGPKRRSAEARRDGVLGEGAATASEPPPSPPHPL